MKIKGNRTYILAGVAVAYVIGGKLGWWPVDEEITGALLAAGLAFLRAGVAATEKLVKEAGE